MIFEMDFSNQKEKIYFIFTGNPLKEGIKKIEFTKEINKIFKSTVFHSNLVQIVTYIRTILKPFEEKILTVKLSNDNTEYCVRYYDGKLVEYSKIEYLTEDKNSQKKLTFTYQSPAKVEYTFFDITAEENLIFKERIRKSICSLMDEIYELTNYALPVKLTYEDKLLFTIYEVFYGELPDLCDPKIVAKFQNMLYILLEKASLRVRLGDKRVSFCGYGKYPEDLNLIGWLRTVKPLYNNIETIDVETFRKNNKDSYGVIKRIGENVKKAFEESKIKKVSIERFCYAIYFKQYSCFSKVTFDEMAKRMKNKYFGKFTKEELQFYYDLKEKL